LLRLVGELVAESYCFVVVFLSVVILLSPTCYELLWPSRVTPILGSRLPPFLASLVSVKNYLGGDILSHGGVFKKDAE